MSWPAAGTTCKQEQGWDETEQGWGETEARVGYHPDSRHHKTARPSALNRQSKDLNNQQFL